MKKLIGFLIIMFFVLTGAGVFAGLVMVGGAIIWAAFKFRELIMLIAYGTGANVAEKVTGEKYTR